MPDSHLPVRCEQGHHEEAVTLAVDALAIAQEYKQIEFIPEAEAMLEQARANAQKTRNLAPSLFRRR